MISDLIAAIRAALTEARREWKRKRLARRFRALPSPFDF